MNFRHLLEQHGPGEALFQEIHAHLASLGHGREKELGDVVGAHRVMAETREEGPA